jgi:hypothetical protein
MKQPDIHQQYFLGIGLLVDASRLLTITEYQNIINHLIDPLWEFG